MTRWRCSICLMPCTYCSVLRCLECQLVTSATSLCLAVPLDAVVQSCAEILVPIVLVYAMYSLKYECHKGIIARLGTKCLVKDETKRVKGHQRVSTKRRFPKKFLASV